MPIAIVLLAFVVLLGVWILFPLMGAGAPAVMGEEWTGRLAGGCALVVGGFLAFALWRATAGKARTRKRLQREYPNEPWKWEEAWSRGEGARAADEQSALFLGMGLLFSLIALPIVPKVVDDYRAGEYVVLLALVFPLVGAGMLAATATRWLRSHRYGSSVLRFSAPGALGGGFRAQLHIPRGLRGTKEIEISLSCVHQVVTGQGKQQKTRTTYKWQDERTTPLQAMGGSAHVPVDFDIPFDTDPTDGTNPRDQIYWEVHAVTVAPGLDFSERFRVPVVATGDGDPEQTQASLRKRSVARSIGRSEFSSFEVHHSADGMHVRMNRLSGLRIVILLLVFGLLSTGVGVAFAAGAWGEGFAFGAVFLWTFVAAFGGVGLLLVILALEQMAGATTLVIGSDRVDYERRYFGLIPSGRVLRAGEFQSVDLCNQAQSGSQVWYDLELQRTGGGRAVRLSCAIADRRDADWLAEQVSRALVREGGER